MRTEFQHLRLKQLDRAIAPFLRAKAVARPAKGWIKAIREAFGLTAEELARRTGGSRQLILQQEKAEAEDRITLKSLRAQAEALDCDLVYVLVPRAESLEALAERRAQAEAKKNVLRVEHSMALEDQASGNLEQAVEAEARRLAKKRTRR